MAGKNGKTPAELAGSIFPINMLVRFKLEKQSVGRWTFWHIEGVHGLLHAYLRGGALQFEELNGQKKISLKMSFDCRIKTFRALKTS